jgi:hypothetical protein
MFNNKKSYHIKVINKIELLYILINIYIYINALDFKIYLIFFK